MEGVQEKLDPYDSWKQEFIAAVLANERDFPPGSVNAHTGAFATAVRVAISTELVEDATRALFNRHTPIRGDNAFQLIMRSAQYDWLEQTGDESFTGWDDPQRCLEYLAEIQDDPDRWGAFYANLASRQVQSNVAERYKPIQLLRALTTDRFDSPPPYLDIGTSELHGPIKAVFGNDPTSVCPPFTSTEIIKMSELKTECVDAELTEKTNVVMSQPMEYGSVVGVDRTNIDDSNTRRWIEACSLKPYERYDPINLKEFRLLNTIDPAHERVRFNRIDFSSPEDFARFRGNSPVDMYDIVSIKTVLHQLSINERINMLKHAREIVSDIGFIVIQEFMGGKTNPKWNYFTEVFDMQMPNDDPQLMMIWKNGRCRSGAFTAGKIIIGGREQVIDDGIRSYAA